MTDLPLTDYCVVVFFLILVISIVQWIVDGRKNYTGPSVDLNAFMQNGEVDGVAPPQMAIEQQEKISEKISETTRSGDEKTSGEVV